MFRLSLVLVLLAAPLAAQSFDPNRKVDGAKNYNSGRMAELPQGANRLKLWVVISPNWRNNPQEKAVAEWFTGGANGMPADIRLRQFRTGCDWNYYFTTSPLFQKTGLMQAVGTAAPIVCLTAPDGDVSRGALLNAGTLPKTAEELADLLTIAAEQLNPPPKMEFGGQVEQTHFVTEAGAPCPGPDCTPVPSPIAQPTPVIDGTVHPVVPQRPVLNDRTVAAGGALTVLSVILTLLGYFKPFARKH